MINEIVSAISNAIYLEFGDEYEIYTEDVKQGLKEPCFSISCINPSIKQFFDKKYKTTNLFNILYFPKNEEIENEINNVRERLFNCLEYINDENYVLRGTNMNTQTVDGVLNFFVNYDFFIKKQIESDSMENFNSITKGVK